VKAISRLGFGVTGPHATPFVSEAETIALVHAAFAAGVTLFDTGPMYGDGEAERRLGRALRELPREKVFVVTKARTFMPDGRFCPPLEAQLRASLRRLETPYVDALLLHGPRVADMGGGWRGDLREAKLAGLVRHAGVCARDGAREALWHEDAGGADPFDVLMTPLDDPTLLARAAQTGVGVLAIETMRGRARFAAPRRAADLWYAARDLRDALRGTAVKQGAGLDAALSYPAVRSVVVTTTRRAHLAENARRAGLTPPRD
jgi:D-threo-aldose 1-dehydrogenase